MALADDSRISVAADDGAHAEAFAIGGDERRGDWGRAVVAAGGLVDAEGDGVEALLDGHGVDAGGDGEEGGDGGELHFDDLELKKL